MTDEDTPFLTAGKFYTAVKEVVRDKGVSYLEATIEVSTSLEIDPEDLLKLKLIAPALKERLYEDGMNEGYLKREATLPF